MVQVDENSDEPARKMDTLDEHAGPTGIKRNRQAPPVEHICNILMPPNPNAKPLPSHPLARPPYALCKIFIAVDWKLTLLVVISSEKTFALNSPLAKSWLGKPRRNRRRHLCPPPASGTNLRSRFPVGGVDLGRFGNPNPHKLVQHLRKDGFA